MFRKIDYFMIFLPLMFQRQRTLAKYPVDLDPSRPVSDDEVVGLIRGRVKKFEPEQLAAIRAAQATG